MRIGSVLLSAVASLALATPACGERERELPVAERDGEMCRPYDPAWAEAVPEGEAQPPPSAEDPQPVDAGSEPTAPDLQGSDPEERDALAERLERVRSLDADALLE